MKNFNNTYKSLLLASLLSLTVPSLYADSKGMIVVSEDVNIQKLTKNELESIFLGKKTIWENGKRIQIGLSTNKNEKTEYFFKNYIGKNERRFKKYWLKLVFAGYGTAPKLFKDNNKAINYTKKQDGVIAFVTTNDIQNIKGLKVISVDGKESF